MSFGTQRAIGPADGMQRVFHSLIGGQMRSFMGTPGVGMQTPAPPLTESSAPRSVIFILWMWVLGRAVRQH